MHHIDVMDRFISNLPLIWAIDYISKKKQKGNVVGYWPMQGALD